MDVLESRMSSCRNHAHHATVVILVTKAPRVPWILSGLCYVSHLLMPHVVFRTQRPQRTVVFDCLVRELRIEQQRQPAVFAELTGNSMRQIRLIKAVHDIESAAKRKKKGVLHRESSTEPTQNRLQPGYHAPCVVGFALEDRKLVDIFPMAHPSR